MNFPNLGCAFFGLIILFVLLGVGAWALMDHYFIDHAIRSAVPLQPELEIRITNTGADTIYVYRAP